MLSLALFLLGCANCAPYIVFDKKIVEEEGKVNEPVHVLYRIFNLGDSPATDLLIDDSGIPLESWDFPETANNIRWNSIAPGANITHIFEVKPLIAGSLRMSSSRLRYAADGQDKIALSAQVFWFEVKATRSIGAKGNIQGYAITIAAAVISIIVPFIAWIVSKPKGGFSKPKTN